MSQAEKEKPHRLCSNDMQWIKAQIAELQEQGWRIEKDHKERGFRQVVMVKD